MSDPFRPIGRGTNAAKKNSDWTPVFPVPQNAPPPPAHHPTLGRPTETFRVFIDLCDDGWRAIECTKNGWTVIDRVPANIKFTRRDGMMSMPDPERVTEQCSGIEELRSFFGNLSQAHFALVVGWVMSCLRDTGVFPVLMVHGESGSGKTVLTKLLMDLIDPRDERALSIPKDDRALIVFAKQTFLVGFENISVIPAWFSDALCRLASGDSFVAVQL
jgi:putative DNA primase/helicase